MLIEDTAQELAAKLRTESEIANGMLNILGVVDGIIGGEDTWDKAPMCEGFMFAVAVTAADAESIPAKGLAALALPDTSAAIYDTARELEQGPGVVGRAVVSVVLKVRNGQFPPDLAGMIADRELTLVAMGFGSEAHTTAKPGPARRTGFIRDEPDAREIRFVLAQDYNGLQYAHVRERGNPEVSVGITTGTSGQSFAGKIPMAMGVLLAAARGAGRGTRN